MEKKVARFIECNTDELREIDGGLGFAGAVGGAIFGAAVGLVSVGVHAAVGNPTTTTLWNGMVAGAAAGFWVGLVFSPI